MYNNLSLLLIATSVRNMLIIFLKFLFATNIVSRLGIHSDFEIRYQQQRRARIWTAVARCALARMASVALRQFRRD